MAVQSVYTAVRLVEVEASSQQIAPLSPARALRHSPSNPWHGRPCSPGLRFGRLSGSCSALFRGKSSPALRTSPDRGGSSAASGVRPQCLPVPDAVAGGAGGFGDATAEGRPRRRGYCRPAGCNPRLRWALKSAPVIQCAVHTSLY